MDGGWCCISWALSKISMPTTRLSTGKRPLASRRYGFSSDGFRQKYQQGDSLSRMVFFFLCFGIFRGTSITAIWDTFRSFWERDIWLTTRHEYTHKICSYCNCPFGIFFAVLPRDPDTACSFLG